MGGIDHLILNHITTIPFEDWLKLENKFFHLENLFRVNTFSYIWLTNKAIPYLTASEGLCTTYISFFPCQTFKIMKAVVTKIRYQYWY